MIKEYKCISFVLSIIYTGWSKKSLWCDLEENIFWWSLSLNIFTSSQEVRAFYIM